MCAGCADETPPPNVLLVSIDTLRADRLSSYGAPRATSPTLDSLARRGARFTNAFTPSPWTLPAHAAMLTGRYPSSLLPDPNDARLYRAGALLSTRLAQRGFHTAAVTGGAYVSRSYGAAEGFDFFRQSGGAKLAARWIRKHARAPFFLFFHTYAPHVPYLDRRFAEGLEAGRFADLYAPSSFGQVHEAMCGGGAAPTDSEKAYLLALYDGGVAQADAMVSTLLAALRERGLEDETVVVVTSDHGEEFWDHTGRCATHGHTLYDELLRVPLIWYDPRRDGDRVIRSPVSLLDIVPTLLARVGAPVPPDLDGVDLAPLLRGDEGDPDRILFGEGLRHGPTRVSARGRDAKLILTGGDEGAVDWGGAPRELYLATDPGETANVIESRPELARSLLVHLEARTRAPAAPAFDGEAPAPDPETLRRLRELGYLEPDAPPAPDRPRAVDPPGY